MDYEFDAPLYHNLADQDSEEHGCLEPVATGNEEKPKLNGKEEALESTHHEEHSPSGGDKPAEGNPRHTHAPKSATRSLHSDKYISQAPRQSPRLAAIAKSIRRSNASRGFVTTSSRASSGIPKAHRRSLSEGANINSHFSKVEKTLVQKRKVAVVKPNQNSGLAEDDMKNLEQTSQYQRVLSANRQRSSASSHSKGPVKPTGGGQPAPLKPTKPAEFHFATSARVKSRDNLNEEVMIDFQQTLRSGCASSSQDHPRGATKVQPFHLHQSSKPKEVVQPFVSVAEMNLKFQNSTPQRFRTKRYGPDAPAFPEPSKKTRSNSARITQAHTPQLATKSRARSINYPTREEVEMKELEEAQKNQFKAKPLNKKVLDEPSIPKPDEATRQPTIPKPFDITDMKKQKVVHKSMEKILLDCCPELMGSAAYLASTPHGGISSSWEKRSTEMKPFSFDSRDSEMIRKKKEKIKMLIDEEKKKAEFHAQPMPIFDGVKGLPTKKPPTPTKVQPFNLRSDVRGSARQEALQMELEALEELEKQQRKFSAQPDTVIHKQPFIPEKSKKPLTDISGFSLNTDRRAEERHEFDVHLKLKEDELKARKMELEERKKLEEEAEVQEMRKNAVHKAQPVRHYKPVEIKHRLLPTTVAISPNFFTDRRLRTRAKSEPSCNVSSNTTINIAEISTAGISNGPADGTFSMDSF